MNKYLSVLQRITIFVVALILFSCLGLQYVIAQTDSSGMVLIRGGSLERWDLDKDVHVDDFYIDTYEVTVREFSDFVKATGYVTDAERIGWATVFLKDYRINTSVGINWRHDEWGNLRPQTEMNYPVVHVSWNDAKAYAKWLGKRLPTPYEFLFITKDADEGLWEEWKKEFKDDNNLTFKKEPSLLLVGQTKPTSIGVYDLFGNVSEWSSGIFITDSSYKSVKDLTINKDRGGALYSVLPSTNFRGPFAYSLVHWCANCEAPDLGFRCAKDASPPKQTPVITEEKSTNYSGDKTKKVFTGSLKDSLIYFQRQVENDPWSIKAHWGLASVLEYIGEYGSAVQEYKWVIKNSTDSKQKADARVHMLTCEYLDHNVKRTSLATKQPENKIITKGQEKEDSKIDTTNISTKSIVEKSGWEYLKGLATSVGVAVGLTALKADAQHIQYAINLLDLWIQAPDGQSIQARNRFLAGMISTLASIITKNKLGPQLGALYDPQMGEMPEGGYAGDMQQQFEEKKFEEEKKIEVSDDLTVTEKWDVPDISGEYKIIATDGSTPVPKLGWSSNTTTIMTCTMNIETYWGSYTFVQNGYQVQIAHIHKVKGTGFGDCGKNNWNQIESESNIVGKLDGRIIRIISSNTRITSTSLVTGNTNVRNEVSPTYNAKYEILQDGRIKATSDLPGWAILEKIR